jgi:hypothetical protein
VISILLALALAAAPASLEERVMAAPARLTPAECKALVPPARCVLASSHVSHPHRDRGKITAFRRAWSKAHGGKPCPGTCQTYVLRGGKFLPYWRCSACAVDHVCALACGGIDEPSNMRWLDAKENDAKSDDCSMCEGASP